MVTGCGRGFSYFEVAVCDHFSELLERAQDLSALCYISRTGICGDVHLRCYARQG